MLNANGQNFQRVQMATCVRCVFSVARDSGWTNVSNFDTAIIPYSGRQSLLSWSAVMVCLRWSLCNQVPPGLAT